MDPTMEEHYLQMARNRPTMLGSEVPLEILEEASHVDHPTGFLIDFFEAGHNQWLFQKYGRRLPRSKDQMAQVAVGLWMKASYLHTSHLLGQSDPQSNKPFFSDES